MSDDLIFEEPPAGKTTRGAGVAGWLDQLREHPGMWAKYPTASKGHLRYAWAIKNGKWAVRGKPGEYEAVGRTIDGECWLFARYVGGES